jgi:type IV pilus assembly protein PilW
MSQRTLPRSQAGMSLVELMVAMLIGLIGIIIITHLYVTNDQYKRSTTGSGTAQVNGAIALYTLEREIRMAGYGLNHSAALGCSCALPNCSPVQYYYNANSSFPPAGAAGGALPPRVLAPVVINDNPVGPDSITVLYGVPNERMLPAALTEATVAPNHDYKVDGVQGFHDNDLIVVTQGSTCVLRQVSKVQAGTTTLEHRAGPFDPAASFGPGFNAAAAVFSLGNFSATSGPVWRTFSVANNRLQSEDVLRSLALLPATASQQLVDDVVDLQAQYGRDDGSILGTTPDDGVVDVWDVAPPVDPLNPAVILWRQVIAVRVGVLVRSQNYEKPDPATGLCGATQAAPTWSGGPFTVPGGVPSCYKHRVFETVIPLRNVIWRPA